jgi:chromate transporter
MNTSTAINNTKPNGFWQIFLIFLRLGLTSFGGPVAHLGYFREEFVNKRKWLSEQSYADIVSLCQFLPGPASSQVGMVLGYSQKSYLGVIAAWLGFTMPSAIALIVFAYGVSGHSQWISPEVIHGLKVVAVAVVAQAVWGMAKSLCPDVSRITVMTIAACLMLIFPSFILGQIAVIVIAGIFGAWYFSPKQLAAHEPLPIQMKHSVGLFWMTLFFALLFILPALNDWYSSQGLAMTSAFYRAGSLVFGGGHVVLPLLQAEVVPTGWVNNETFLAGYGATQAMPGPLFTFAAFLGASTIGAPTGWVGGMICLLAIFAPSFLLVAGTLPFWETLRRNTKIQAALMGVNAAVVGILLSALYDPVWTSAIHKPMDFALGLLAFVALMYWKVSPWIVVVASGLAFWVLAILF